VKKMLTCAAIAALVSTSARAETIWDAALALLSPAQQKVAKQAIHNYTIELVRPNGTIVTSKKDPEYPVMIHYVTLCTVTVARNLKGGHLTTAGQVAGDEAHCLRYWTKDRRLALKVVLTP
jgi:hypothetical protein